DGAAGRHRPLRGRRQRGGERAAARHRLGRPGRVSDDRAVASAPEGLRRAAALVAARHAGVPARGRRVALGPPPRRSAAAPARARRGAGADGRARERGVERVRGVVRWRRPGCRAPRARRPAGGSMAGVCWLAGMGLLLLGACASGAPPAAPAAPAPAAATVATAAPSPPAPRAHLSLVYSTQSAGNSPWQLAQDQGIWQQNGLDVEMAYAPANIVPTALVQGQAQVVGLSCGEMGLAVAGGADIFQMFAMPNPRLLYMIVAREGIMRLEDLRGLRLAMNRPGSAPYVAAKLIFGQVGMDPEREVTYVTMGGTPERVAALLAGSVDAAILSSDE